MVELAMMLPILILLLIMAIDFGRAFFGWVGVQNAARIGANYAANYPLEGDYSNPSDPNTQDYEAAVRADAAAINCSLPDPLPEPTFPNGTGPGGDAVVGLTCEFTPVTPLALNLFGGPIDLAAEATFPIRTGIVGGPGGGGGGGGGDDSLCRIVPDLDGMVVADAENAWTVAGFAGTFSYTGSASDLVVDDSQITDPGSIPGQCITFEASVTVTTVAPPACASGESLVPQIAGLLLSQARERWADSGFDAANFDPESGFDDEVVSDWTTSDPFDAGECAPSATTTVTVMHEEAPDPAPCEVPDFIGTNANQAQTKWNQAGFSTTVQFSSTGNFKIGKQSINAGSLVNCSSTVILLEPGGGN